jgi:plastocyanin
MRSTITGPIVGYHPSVRRAFALVFAAGLLLGACGDDSQLDPEAQEDETPAECSDVSSSEGAPAPVTMKETFFEPQCLAVSSTQQLILANAGSALHNFSIEDQGVDIDVEAGSEVTTDPLEDLVRPGTFRFVCKYHESQGMVGTLTVE